MKVLVNKEGIITIDPQESDVVSVVNLLKDKYYDVKVDMQYKETNPVYFLSEGAFFNGEEKIATYNRNKKLEFVKNILDYFKIKYVEVKEDCEDVPDKDKVYLDIDSGGYDVTLIINDEIKDFLHDDDVEDGLDDEISRLLNALGHEIKWTYERFPSGNVCKCCYSSDLYEYEQDGDIRGDCEVCGKTNMLHMR